MLAVSAGLGAFAGVPVVFAEQVKQRCLFQFDGAIGFLALIYQQGKFDPCFFPKSLRIVQIAHAYGGQARSFIAECRLRLTQLRNVLAAEDSAVMAQEDQHYRVIRPQRAQAEVMAVAIG